MAGKGLFIVMAKITSDKEEAFNKWYHEEHIPQALERLPGMLSARRYKIMDVRTLREDGSVERQEKPEYQYMTMYEVENYELMQKGLESNLLADSIAEYNKAFGVGGRHHIRAVEVKSLKVG